MGLLKNLLGTIVDEVQKRNQENANVKTADARVFEDIRQKFGGVSEDSGRSRADVYKDFMEKLKQSQQENEASQEVETADKSVFDDFVQEIGRLETRVESQTAGQAPVIDFKTSPSPSASAGAGVQAMTNSGGGSLQMRQGPDMGAPKFDIWVPDSSLLRVLKYSDNSIILDGAKSRFALVDYNGQQGWVLEKYLNFN